MTNELDITSGDPIQDPGLPEHQYRPQDVDEAYARRTERQIAAMFGLATLLFIGFCVAYFTIPQDATVFRVGSLVGFSAQNFAFGVTLGGGLLLVGIGIIQWAKKLMGDYEMVELRHPVASGK